MTILSHPSLSPCLSELAMQVFQMPQTAWRVTCILLLTILLSACDTPSKKFDSAEWKTGDATTRGSMAQALIDSKVLVGKSAVEVEALLGKPDLREADWYGYKVVT